MPTPKQHADNAAKQRAYRQRQREALAAAQKAKGLPPAPPIPTMPGTARWTAMMTAAYDLLNSAEAEMTAYYDDRTEQWQESDKGNEFERRLDNLREIVEQLADLR